MASFKMHLIFRSSFQKIRPVEAFWTWMEPHFLAEQAPKAFPQLCHRKKAENSACKVIQRHFHSSTFKGDQENSDPVGEGQDFLWTAWKILPVCAQRGGPCGGEPRDYRTTSQKWSVPALAGWRHRKVTSPRDWSQSKDPSLGRSASPFFISPGSFNANLLNCLFIAGSSRLVELRNVYSCTVVYRAALRHGIYYVWSFITTIHIRADGEHESNTALLLPTALCYRWQEIGDPKAQ